MYATRKKAGIEEHYEKKLLRDSSGSKSDSINFSQPSRHGNFVQGDVALVRNMIRSEPRVVAPKLERFEIHSAKEELHIITNVRVYEDHGRTLLQVDKPTERPTTLQSERYATLTILPGYYTVNSRLNVERIEGAISGMAGGVG